MKYYSTILLLLICLIQIIQNKISFDTDINLPNFDVREKFKDCYNDGTSSIYNEITCYTNWPIQFSMMLTDKICIKKGTKTKVLSSMNINSCMKLNEKIQNCRTLREFYNTTSSAFVVVNETIKFFNKNGSQFLDEVPYTLLQDDQEQPGYFPPCKDFNSSVVNVTVDPNYVIYDETKEDEFKYVKNLIYEEGPLIAFIDSK